MSNCSTKLCGVAPVIGGVSLGVIGSALGAFSGSVGAEILDNAGYLGYRPIEAAKMGAIGGAVIYGASGVLSGSLASCGLFSIQKKSDESKTMNSIAVYTTSMLLTGLTGYGIMNSREQQTVMELGKTAASFALGGAITALPARFVLLCLALPIVLAMSVALEESSIDVENAVETKYSNSESLSVFRKV